MIDPQQRVLLEAAAELLAARPQSSSTSRAGQGTGVFVGISTPDYADIKKAATPIGVYSATGVPCMHHTIARPE
jgi:acyl transferase domain-containing protein